MIESILSLFVLGTIGFWFLLALACVIIVSALELENGKWATSTLVITGILVAFGNHWHILGYLRTNWLMIIAFVLAYFAAGTGWSIAKWTLYVHNLFDRYSDIKRQYLAKYNVASVPLLPDNALTSFGREIRSAGIPTNTNDVISAPLVGDHKATILMWMTYWPWSFVWTLINDPIKKAFRKIYSQIAQFLQNISNRTFAKIQADFKA